MKRPELFAAFRSAADDAAQPYLWEDHEVQRYLDDACREAAERSWCIRDSSTAAVCSVAVIAGTASYTLHASVLHVDRARLTAERYPLVLSSTEEMDRERPGWDANAASGTPARALLDAEGASWKLTLVPTPVTDGTLALVVFRTPLASVASDDDAPEIPARYHEQLIDWMLRCAYLKRDSETQDEDKAAKAEARFTASFGPRIDANTKRKQRDRGTAQVVFREF